MTRKITIMLNVHKKNITNVFWGRFENSAWKWCCYHQDISTSHNSPWCYTGQTPTSSLHTVQSHVPKDQQKVNQPSQVMGQKREWKHVRSQNLKMCSSLGQSQLSKPTPHLHPATASSTWGFTPNEKIYLKSAVPTVISGNSPWSQQGLIPVAANSV